MSKRCWDLNRLFKESAKWAFSIVSIILVFVPNAVFAAIVTIPNWAIQFLPVDNNAEDEIRAASSKLLFLLIAFIIAFFAQINRKTVKIKGNNYIIEVKYGDLFKEKKCKKVINFDECYTSHVGANPSDIKATSICGQYLQTKGEDFDIQRLIDNSEVKPEKTTSKFKGMPGYKPGTIIANEDALLLAFATLNENGRAKFYTRDEFIECLSRMWEQIELNCSQTDVCVPILGSGLTLFEGCGDSSPSQQDLLNIMIWSYKLSSHKVKAPFKLRIVCQKRDGFSLNKVDA